MVWENKWCFCKSVTGVVSYLLRSTEENFLVKGQTSCGLTSLNGEITRGIEEVRVKNKLV